MKRHLISKILQFWSNSEPKRKKQILFGIGIFAVTGVSILIVSIWLSLKLVGFLWNDVKTMGGAYLNPEQTQVGQIQVLEKSPYNVATCVNQLTSLFAIEPWLQTPIIETLRSTYLKCIQPIEPKNIRTQNNPEFLNQNTIKISYINRNLIERGTV